MYDLLVPELIERIPDIAEIYAINDEQADELDRVLESLEANIFISTMNEEKTKRWEAILSLKPKDTDSLDDRRFRVRSKVLEKLPYSYRVLLRKLEALCPDGVELIVNNAEENVVVRVALKSRAMTEEIDSMLDAILPLNMTYLVIIMFNSWGMFMNRTWEQMQKMTWKIMREKVLE